MLTTSLCLIQGVLYELLIGFMVVSSSFCFTYCHVRQTKLASSLDNVWAHYKIVIVWLIVWLTDRSISRSFFVIIASSCILSTCSMSARHQCEASTWRHDAHFSTVVRGCCCGCRCRFRRPWSWRCLFLSLSSLLLLLLLLSTRGCRDFVWAPKEWLTARRNYRRL